MDRINSSPNMHALRAYASAAPVQRPAGAPIVAQPKQATTTTETAPIAKIGSPTDPRPGSDPSRLVAAKVDPINLQSDITPLQGITPKVTSAGTYALHTTPASAHAAATGVHAGRSLDLRG